MHTVSDQNPNVVDNLETNVSRVVRILMARDSVSQQDLAKALEVNKSMVTRAFKGERLWKLEDLGKMAKVFDEPVTVFFEDASLVLRNRWHSQLVDA